MSNKISYDAFNGGGISRFGRTARRSLQSSLEFRRTAFARPHVSLYALEGTANPKTLRIPGRIGKSSAHVFIDGGRTHNFLQEHVAKFLGLPTTSSQPFSVLVGNGASLFGNVHQSS